MYYAVRRTMTGDLNVEGSSQVAIDGSAFATGKFVREVYQKVWTGMAMHFKKWFLCLQSESPELLGKLESLFPGLTSSLRDMKVASDDSDKEPYRKMYLKMLRLSKVLCSWRYICRKKNYESTFAELGTLIDKLWGTQKWGKKPVLYSQYLPDRYADDAFYVPTPSGRSKKRAGLDTCANSKKMPRRPLRRPRATKCEYFRPDVDSPQHNLWELLYTDLLWSPDTPFTILPTGVSKEDLESFLAQDGKKNLLEMAAACIGDQTDIMSLPLTQLRNIPAFNRRGIDNAYDSMRAKPSSIDETSKVNGCSQVSQFKYYGYFPYDLPKDISNISEFVQREQELYIAALEDDTIATLSAASTKNFPPYVSTLGAQTLGAGTAKICVLRCDTLHGRGSLKWREALELYWGDNTSWTSDNGSTF